MNTRKIRHPKLLSIALAALSYSVAFAQTNTLPSTYVYPTSAANTNAPGFVWNVNQSATFQNSSIAGADAVLSGEYGPNTVDPLQIYDETPTNGTVPSNPNLPITFDLAGVINFSIAGSAGSPDCGDNRIDLPCEDGMPGIPGTGGSTTGFAAEALTYIALPAGLTTMGVTSDDGFELQIGAANPSDRYSTNALVVEEYNGTRGHADSIVTFNVAKAGLYAARLLYFQGGGDASVEWYTFPPAGSTNLFLGMDNTGTNAVLVNDVADGGIAAYQSITTPPVAAFLSSLAPAPGATGVPPEPIISATLVNGVVPVSDITLSVDGTTLPATVTTNTTGATIAYTVTNALSGGGHTLVLSWNDNGTTESVTSTFQSLNYLILSASQAVTPDTTKPGFRFNIFANTADYLASGSLGFGVQGGDNDNTDNTELGLNGLEPDGMGGILPNEVNVTNIGAAKGAAPALGGPNAPAEFVVSNTINFNIANMPGFPCLDTSGGDPSHSEVLTYVGLPAGLTTFTLNLDGVYRAFAGSWDYTVAQMAGRANNLINNSTASFSILAPVAGYYPLRVTVFNMDGTPQESLYTTTPSGNNVLVGDVANGGLAVYYATSTPSKPYIRYTSPRPVPRQVEYPNNRVLVRIQDGDITANGSTAVFNLDGKTVTTTNDRVGDVYEMTWTPTTLQTPAEIHTGILTYQDASGDSISENWQFLNLKAVWLPTATPGFWLPTNAVAFENFSEYSDPTEFTNDPPTTAYFMSIADSYTHESQAPLGQWYKSPQPENPLVDVCPVWTNVPAGPTDWFVWNFDEGDGGGWGDTSANSGAYANWLCVDLNAFSMIEGSSLNTAPGEMINGIPLVQLIADPSQNVVMAESDNREGDQIVDGGLGNGGQTQFLLSKSFNLSSVTNPVVAWASIYKQNQDNLGAVEYSVDGGMTWAPIIYYLDEGEFSDPGDPADLQVNLDNTVNVTNSLLHDTDPGEIPTWHDSTGDVNNTYASGIGAPISQALAPFFAPRCNDDSYDGKRIEVVRLPLAAHQSNVRLRFAQIGTCSWYIGAGQIAFYDVPPSGAIVPTGLPPAPSGPTLSIASVTGGKVTVNWSGTGTLQSATTLTGKASDWSNVSPAPTGSTYTAPIGAGTLFFRLISN